MSNTQDLQALARECGATAYTNRHYPDGTALAFGPEAFAKFCAALQSPAPQPPGDAHALSMLYLQLTEAMGYDSRSELSPEEWAQDLVKRATTQPPGDAREAFEAFYKDSSTPFWKEPNGEYVYYKSEWTAFQAGAAWQAAQASAPSAEQLLDAIRHAGFTAVKTTHGVHLMKLGEVTAYAAPARAVEPLTEAQIEAMAASKGYRRGTWNAIRYREAARDTERAHGITTPAAKGGE